MGDSVNQGWWRASTAVSRNDGWYARNLSMRSIHVDPAAAGGKFGRSVCRSCLGVIWKVTFPASGRRLKSWRTLCV